jgi:hypothetical protein
MREKVGRHKKMKKLINKLRKSRFTSGVGVTNIHTMPSAVALKSCNDSVSLESDTIEFLALVIDV